MQNKLEGIGWFTFEVLRRLVRLRPQDEFIFFFDRDFDEQFIFDKNVTGVRLFPPARHPFLWYCWFEFSLVQGLKSQKADLFFSPDGFCSLATDVPTLMVTHDIAHHHFPEQVPFLSRWYYRIMVPRYLKRADHIITVSNFTKKDIETTYGIASEKMTVAHNGSRPLFRPLAGTEQEEVRRIFSKGSPFFLYYGAVHPRKNVHRLITAFDHFKNNFESGVKLLIAGRFAWQTGPVKSAYEKAIHKMDIHFLGYLSEEDLTSVTASALGVVYVSGFEGFGLPILEAMHAEVPVITSNVSSLPEVAGEAAILVNPENPEDIETAMHQLWSQPGRRADLVEKGKRQREQFNWDKTVAVINEKIDQIEI